MAVVPVNVGTRGARPVNLGLSPDLPTANTQLYSCASCQGNWDGRLILQRVCITLLQLRTSIACCQLCYWGKCLCAIQDLTMPQVRCLNLCSFVPITFRCHVYYVSTSVCHATDSLESWSFGFNWKIYCSHIFLYAKSEFIHRWLGKNLWMNLWIWLAMCLLIENIQTTVNKACLKLTFKTNF